MTTLSKDDYLKQSRALATGFGPTTDFTDPQRGTTVQSEEGIPTAASELPGQVFTVDQLPDPAVAVAYGLPPQTVPEHLILDDAEDGLRHVQGKSALDVINGQLREKLGHPVLAFDNTIRSADESLVHFAQQTGPGLGGALDDNGEDAGAPFVDGIKGGDGETTTSTTGAEGPIDPEGVQKGDGDEKAVSEEAGTKGEANTGSDDKDAGKDTQSAKAQQKAKDQQKS